VTALARQDRFNDCRYDVEPGCAIRGGLNVGELDEAQLARWRKLVAEERFISAPVAEHEAGQKALHRTIRDIGKRNRT